MTVRLLTEAFADDPVLDTALSRALLERVAGGELGEAFRLARPGPMVSFGRLDILEPGFPEAVAAARAHGFAAVKRVGGGRAAVFHEDAILFGHAVREDDPRAGTTRRFVELSELCAAALRRLGVDAAVGELPGEYCPGAYSVHAGGVKLVGIAQRVVRDGAWTEGVLVVRGGERVRDVLVPVYDALGLEWDPRTAGSLADVLPDVTFEAAAGALRAELADRHQLTGGDLDPDTLERARVLRDLHDAEATARISG